MQIQINTGRNIDGNEALAAYARGETEHTLSRFNDHVTRVEVHLSDENSDKKRQRRSAVHYGSPARRASAHCSHSSGHNTGTGRQGRSRKVIPIDREHHWTVAKSAGSQG